MRVLMFGGLLGIAKFLGRTGVPISTEGEYTHCSAFVAAAAMRAYERREYRLVA